MVRDQVQSSQWNLVMRLLRNIGLLSLAVLVLVACGSNRKPIEELLPLAEERPTFVYFFTPN
jgi:hypothetical protein